MPELNHAYAEQNTAQGVTATSWTTPTVVLSIPGADLTPNTHYLLLARAVIRTESSTDKVYIRVNSADDTILADKSESIYELNATAGTPSRESKSWFFPHSFDTDAVPADVELQMFRDGSATVEADQLSMFVLDLDEVGVEGTDYHEDIDAGNGLTLGVSFGVHSWIQRANLGVVDDWLTFGMMRVGVASTGRWFQTIFRGSIDSQVIDELGSIKEEGEDTSELRMSGFMARHKSFITEGDIDIGGWNEASNANHTDEGSYVIAIKDTHFPKFRFQSVASPADITTAGETLAATVAFYTPGHAGNHLILGTMGVVSGQAANVRLWVEDGTTEVRTGDSYPTHDMGWDTAKDEQTAYTMQRVDLPATQKTWNLRAQAEHSTQGTRDGWLIVIQLSTGTDHVQEIVDDVGVTDTAETAKEIPVTVADDVGVTVAVDPILTAAQEEAVIDPVGVTDTVERLADAGRAVTDLVGVTDTVEPAKTVAVEIIDDVGIGDVVTDDLSQVAATVEAWGLIPI